MSPLSPTASSSSDSFSYSPRTMSSDLGLDPLDPLNLLLHNTTQNPDSSMEDSSSQSEAASPPDWAQLTSLWPDNNADPSGVCAAKAYADLMDFTDLSSLPMDMDFNPSMSIDPSALHFDPMKFANSAMHYSYDTQSAFDGLGNDLLSTQFPFTFESSLDTSGFSSSSSPSVSSGSPSLSSKERRLSVTSSSSSGPSFSPAPESSPSPTPAGYTSNASQQQQQNQSAAFVEESAASFANDPAAELAQRVRQSAGVMLAVPMGAQLQGHGVNRQVSIPVTNTTQAKLPIPRLPRHNIPNSTKSSSPSTSSSAASTPPPSTPPLSSAPAPQLSINTGIPLPPNSSAIITPTTAVPTSTAPRPKTSHTTIERRYRTNLNARIQSLRMAVPALRVLEDREGNGKKIKKNVRGGVPVKGSPEAEEGVVDVIDERGFVDGVKVARKCSKANVLGKAVEYIRVLKRREMRLKSEQAGLKMLVGGLVGGPALLREWEREWRERFGGEERDEVEGEPDAEGDDEDSDDGEDDGEEEVGRKRKRGRVSGASSASAAVKEEKPVKEKKPPALQVPLEPGAVPEKRKRGRPRKVVPPPVPIAPPAPIIAQSEPAQPDQTMYAPTDTAQQWAQVQQQQAEPQQYLLAVFALFSFFNSPFTSSTSSSSNASATHRHTGTVLTSQPPLAYAPEIVAQFAPPVTGAWGWREYMQVFHLLVSVVVLLSFVANRAGISWRKMKSQQNGAVSVAGLSLSKEETMDRVKQGEQYVLGGHAKKLSLFDRFQIYRAVSSSCNAPVAQQATIAMIVWGVGGVFGGLARAKARGIWDAAKAHAEVIHLKPGSSLKVNGPEKLVLDELDVDAAVARLTEASTADKIQGDDRRVYTPIEVLGCMLVRERVKKHLGSLFVDAVNSSSEQQEKDKEQEEKEHVEMRRTVDIAKDLGGRVGELGRVLERVWKTPASVLLEDTVAIHADEEVKALLTALVLYRQVFTSLRMAGAELTLLSPPPSPKGKEEGGKVYELRKALGSRVFEEGDLEDARDRVVDLVVDSERRGRAGTP